MTNFSSSPADKKAIARQTAKMMLEIKAIHFNADSPFFFTSGWASPVYVDCRKIISYPRMRSGMMDFASSVILSEIGYESIDNVAGGETAGIPFAAWIADKLMLPMQYIRKKAKGFGRNAQIEGDLLEGGRTLLVEDLATDGRSKVNFCNALRKAGAQVDHCFVLFYYDIFPETQGHIRDLNVKLHHLATWWDVLDVAEESGAFDAGILREVRGFLNQPSKWSAAHGGISDFDAVPQQSENIAPGPFLRTGSHG
jgi:orotate phosphoribosyltransferase